jgi:phosphoribosylamine--glycine ligase
VVLPRIESDLAELLAAAAAGRLGEAPRFDDGAAVTVVLAAEGYPQAPRTGDRILGLEEARSRPGVTVFAAGVGADESGALVTAGGRVLAVTGQGPTVAEARRVAYDAAEAITWPGRHLRTDIAG